MSVRIDWSKVANNEELWQTCGQNELGMTDFSRMESDGTLKKMNPVSAALVWRVLATGFPMHDNWEITEENCKELYRRSLILDRVDGTSLQVLGEHGLEPMALTYADFRRHVGLGINAGNKGEGEFKRHVWSLLISSVSRKMREEVDAYDQNNARVDEPGSPAGGKVHR